MGSNDIKCMVFSISLSMQVDSDVEWMEGPRDSSANKELFNCAESVDFFITQTFTPSAITMSWTHGGVKVWMLSSLHVSISKIIAILNDFICNN